MQLFQIKIQILKSSRKINYWNFSIRRAMQIKKIRPDLIIKDIRGNVDTRLKKLKKKVMTQLFLHMPV